MGFTKKGAGRIAGPAIPLILLLGLADVASASSSNAHSVYDSLISEYAALHEVDAALVKAVVYAESRFDPDAVSRRGARGLMQLMPDTASLLGVENVHDPRENIAGGVRLLERLLSRFGNVDMAVAAYNAGTAAVKKYRGVPPYRETKRFVKTVLRYRDVFAGDGSLGLHGSAPVMAALAPETSRPVTRKPTASGPVPVARPPVELDRWGSEATFRIAGFHPR